MSAVDLSVAPAMKPENLQPTAGRVVVRTKQVKNQVRNVHLPEGVRRAGVHILEAEVLAVGPKRLTITGAELPHQCAQGDTVIMVSVAGWAAETLYDNDEMKNIVILNEEDIAAVVR